ncbi:hypothetical protein EDD22DRAFT_961059 [Suillus occidentalis]|nr:hypothetical protein EDD22DRAFT_961059 [Suillus occidentalis]
MTPPCKLSPHAPPSPSNPQAKKIWPTRDSPNNPFLAGENEADASGWESSDDRLPVGEAPGCKTSTPVFEEKPTINYVCRGQKATFHNPQYHLPLELIEASKLPIDHPDFEAAEAYPPLRLFINQLKRKSRDFDKDAPPINSLGAKRARLDAGASEGKKGTAKARECTERDGN